jgi:hypothetical protein
MLTIRKPIGLIALLVVLGASAIAPTLASAKGKTSHKYTSSVQTAPLTTDNGYPAPGGTALLVGTVNAKPLGSGALIDRVTVTGQPAPNVLAFEGKETDLFAAGTLKNTFSGTATIQPDGSQVVAIEGRVTGGTARYRGASGRYTFSGTVAAGSTLLVGHGSGTVAY